MSRFDQTGIGVVEGGYDTTYLSAAEQDRVAREQRQADALRYLTRKGHADVAAILGLVDSPAPKRQPRKRIGDGR